MEGKLKTLQYIHLFLFGGVVMAYVLLGDLTSLNLLKPPSFSSESLLLLAIPISAILMGQFLFKKTLRKINPKASFDEKFSAYQSASITRWACVEGVCFIILFMLPDYVYLGICAVLLLFFLRPTKTLLENDLNLHLRNH